MNKKVSVVIPFYNGVGRLRACLNALARQTYPAADYEIVAIDNGSTEDVTSLRQAFPEVRWLFEAQPGPACARNRGLTQATGDVIAFTDADCLPAPNWLQEAVNALENTGATVIGGRIDYIDPPGGSLNPNEMIEENFFLLARQKYLVEKLGVAATANLITYRKIVDKIGGFDPALLSFCDGDWVQRATRVGEILVYADAALVLHPRRSTFRGLFNKVRRTAGDKIVFMKKRRETIAAFLRDLFRFSPLSPLVHGTALVFPNARGLGQRIHLFFLVELLCLAATFERLRMLLGGKGYRG